MTLSARGYVFTINNPEGTSQNLIDYMKDTYPKMFKYMAVGLEEGKEGTPHLQGYIEFNDSMPFDRLKEHLPKAHLESRRGSPKQARDYVFKSETKIEEPIEEGKLPKGSGKRSDLDDIANMIENGSTPSEIRKAYPSQYLRYNNHIKTLYQEVLEEEYKHTERDLTIYYVYGPTRTGKTSGVYKQYGMDNVYRVSNYENPFDGYQGEDVVALEEFHGSLPMSYMLQLMEGYPLKLKARYQDKVACYTKLIIISNKRLDDQYPEMQYSHDIDVLFAFKNRITAEIRVEKFGDFEKSVDVVEGNTDDLPPVNIKLHKGRY